MNAGWVEPVVLDSGAHLGGVSEWERRDHQNRPAPLAMRAWLLALALGGLALGVVALTANPERTPDAAVRNPAPFSSGFHPRSDLPPLIFVRSLDGGKAAAAYEAETRDGDGARKDALTLGDPSSDKPFLRASASLGGTSSRTRLFFVEMARQAAEIGESVARASSPQAEAAGGSLLVADLTLEAGGRQRACLGFRFGGAAATDVSGIACGGAGEPVERAALECLISRLEATPAGSAAGLEKALRSPALARPPSC